MYNHSISTQEIHERIKRGTIFLWYSYFQGWTNIFSEKGYLFLLRFLTQCYWFKTFIESKLHIIFIAYSKLNIRRVHPIESSVVDGSTRSSVVGTKPKTQQYSTFRITQIQCPLTGPIDIWGGVWVGLKENYCSFWRDCLNKNLCSLFCDMAVKLWKL